MNWSLSSEISALAFPCIYVNQPTRSSWWKFVTLVCNPANYLTWFGIVKMPLQWIISMIEGKTWNFRGRNPKCSPSDWTNMLPVPDISSTSIESALDLKQIKEKNDTIKSQSLIVEKILKKTASAPNPNASEYYDCPYLMFHFKLQVEKKKEQFRLFLCWRTINMSDKPVEVSLPSWRHIIYGQMCPIVELMQFKDEVIPLEILKNYNLQGRYGSWRSRHRSKKEVDRRSFGCVRSLETSPRNFHCKDQHLV